MRARLLFLSALAGGLTACLIVRSTRIEAVNVSAGGQVKSRVRAHLIDGTTIVFPHGLSIRQQTVVGRGVHYGLRLQSAAPVNSIPLDQVVAMESYRTEVDGGATILASLALTAATVGGAIAIACAIDPKCFGSCPTFYSDSAGVPVLEAEGFSYSIARLFEARDVDRMRATADSAGVVRLEVRNEALETHYLNHLELLEVRHGADEHAVPDPNGLPVLARSLRPVSRALDKSGRSVDRLLREADGQVYRTDSTVLARADSVDFLDFIDLEIPNPTASDSVVLVFRMRNSLLNTVLFYDVMLADRGAGALDWMAGDLAALGPATELGRFARTHMGLRVSVPDGPAWREVGRLPDTGPVAWKQQAIVVPATSRDVQRVRISFVADDWRIDQVLATSQWRRGQTRVVPLARVIGVDGTRDTTAFGSMYRPDLRYLETIAGQRFFTEYDAGRFEGSRTFFLASQGYYTEWVRRGWLDQKIASSPVPIGPAAIVSAIRRWQSSQDSTERLFYATKVPVR